MSETLLQMLSLTCLLYIMIKHLLVNFIFSKRSELKWKWKPEVQVSILHWSMCRVIYLVLGRQFLNWQKSNLNSEFEYYFNLEVIKHWSFCFCFCFCFCHVIASFIMLKIMQWLWTAHFSWTNQVCGIMI